MQAPRYELLSPDVIADLVIDHLANGTTIPDGLRKAACDVGLGDLLKDPVHEEDLHDE